MWLPPPCPPPPCLPSPLPLPHICLEFWNERKQKELCPKYVNNCLGFSIPEHVVWHSELKWLLQKSYWIFLNDLHTAMPWDSLLHFGIQLINIRLFKIYVYIFIFIYIIYLYLYLYIIYLYVSLCLRVQNVVSAQPCVGKFRIPNSIELFAL